MSGKHRAKIYRGTPRNLAMLANKLRAGELVAVPSETVYGLAANALDARACRAIFRAKGRPTSDPLIVHIHHLDQLEEIARANPLAFKLAQTFWPGPLTMVLPKQSVVPDIVTAGLDSVAVRMPQHPLFRRLLKCCGLPLAAPSANPFGYVSPTTAAHVHDQLHDKIHYILDGGSSEVGLESTIVDLRNPRKIRVLRPGAITAEQVAETLQLPVGGAVAKAAPQNKGQVAPGMLTQHYSPRARVILHTKESLAKLRTDDNRAALLFFAKPAGALTPHTFWLDAGGDQVRAARALFASLRALDAKGYATIHVELALPGIRSAAINDRLKRAAAKQ